MAPDVGSSPTPGTISPASGWWKDFLDIVPEGYFDLLAAEEDASWIVHFHPTLVPGLLQTEAYATAITPTTSLKSMTPADVAMLVQVRMLRQRAAFDESRAKRLSFLVDETALHRTVGEPRVMRDQLIHLLDVAQRPTVSLTVISKAQPHPGWLGAFMLMHFGGGLPDILWFEWQLGNKVIRDQPQLVGRYRDLANQLMELDRDGATSRRLIESALAGYREK
jgi:Domain of unknown function (DUF5753)